MTDLFEKDIKAGARTVSGEADLAADKIFEKKSMVDLAVKPSSELFVPIS